MADKDTIAEAKDALAEAKDAFKRVSDAEDDQRKAMLSDLRFVKLADQWPEAAKQQREKEKRPCLTINRMPSFIKQVTNDARQNRPAIKTHPVGDGADRETSQILDGLIRNIEYQSNAEVAYDTALDFAASCGIGYFRVKADYATDDAWDIDLLIDRIDNPFSVYGDPESTAADSSDWNSAFVTQMMSERKFKAQYPDAKKSSFESIAEAENSELWYEDDAVRVAEWWRRQMVMAKLLKLSNGALMMEPEFLKVQDLLMAQGTTVTGDRPAKTWKVEQLIITGAEVLETNPWRGKYIPIVPVYGDEVNIEGKRSFQSLIWHAKDAQRLYNYFRSAAAENVALSTKAPWIGPAEAFEEEPEKWATANTEAHAYIAYGGQTAPTRQGFAGIPAGDMQMMMTASDEMKSILGIYDASLGARSNETSGRAIMARQREGDVSTFNYIDNLSRAIRHAGRILVDLIPKHYDVERIVRCIKEDGTNYQVPINQPVEQMETPMGAPPQFQARPDVPNPVPPELQGIVKVFDLSAGKYDVTCEAGPSFTTRREEAAMQMTEMVKAFPATFPVIGDLLAKNLDWPGADEIAERFRQASPIAQGQNPQVVQLQQQIQAMGQQMGQMKQALDDKRGDQALQQEKIAVDREKVDVDRMRAQTDAAQARAQLLQQEAQAAQMPDISQIVAAVREIGAAVQQLQQAVADTQNSDALAQLAEMQQGLADALQGLQQQVEQAAQLAVAPRTLVKDKQGNTTAVRIGDTERPVQRGADGSITF